MNEQEIKYQKAKERVAALREFLRTSWRVRNRKPGLVSNQYDDVPRKSLVRLAAHGMGHCHCSACVASFWWDT